MRSVRLTSPGTVSELCLAWLAVVALFVSRVSAQEAAPADPPVPPAGPIGQFVTVSSPIDDTVYARVSAAALDLKSQAARENRKGILVLQIESGTSPFHQVQGLTKFLTSAAVAGLTTVAWVPQTVTGPNVLVALACREIVMHPDAELGDISRGKPLDPEDEQTALALGAKRNNPKVSTALIQGMLDPQEQLWRVQVERADGQSETRIATVDELETLRKTNVTLNNPEIIKERGVTGVFKGSTSRALNMLVSQTAENRAAVSELYRLPREAMRENLAQGDGRKVRLIRVEGTIDPLLESFLERQVRRAIAQGAKILILEIDSPGGQLLASLNLANLLADLNPQEVRTVAYVPKMALSGAAIIALGCDEIVMHPDARFGDAGPIEMKAGGQFERVPEKLLSPLRVSLRHLAEKKGRAPALAEAMAFRTLKVFEVTNRETGRISYMSEEDLHNSNGEWIQGPQLRETNGELLLTVDGKRAHELKLAERPVADFQELRSRLGIPPDTRIAPLQQTWVDNTVFLLNTTGMKVLLLVLGVALLYVELHFMTGILGLSSVLCFVLFFWSSVLGGTAGWLEITLFVFGISCLALEVFVIPGFGVFGVTGILSMLVSLVMALQTFGNFEPGADLDSLLKSIGTVLGAFLGVGILGVALARVLPHTPLYDQMTLGPPGVDDTTPRLRRENDPSELAAGLVGRRGRSLTMLRPSGKAEIGGQVYDVQSDGQFIAAEATIEVVSAQGVRVIVREVV